MRILDVGCGQHPKLTSNYSEIEIVNCDIKEAPGVEVQDMEQLTYPDDSFDVVVCVNALDHTINAEKALNELIRVGGAVYVNCALDQKTRHHKKHYWDAKADGKFVNETEFFDLKDYGFKIEFEDGRVMAWLA